MSDDVWTPVALAMPRASGKNWLSQRWAEHAATTPTEGDSMARTKEQIQTELDEATRKLQRARTKGDAWFDRVVTLQAELKEASYPAEPQCHLISFSLRFIEGKVYEYAARRVGGRWYTTGRTCPAAGYSWPELVDMIRDSSWHSHVQVYGATIDTVRV